MISSPGNKKPLWRYIKVKQQDHTGISTLKDPENGQPITNPASKAGILNQHFKSVFTAEDRSSIPDKEPIPLSIYNRFSHYFRGYFIKSYLTVIHTNLLVQIPSIHMH